MAHQININTETLQAILNEIQALPEAGGGVPDGLSAIEVIEWTPSANCISADISHSLGVVPDGYVIASLSTITDASSSAYYIPAYFFDKRCKVSSSTMHAIYLYHLSSSAATPSSYSNTSTSNFATDAQIKPNSGSSNKYFKGGVTYHIVVYKR